MASTDRETANPILRVFSQRKMAAILLLGFSSGLPLFLTSRTLQAWMTVEEVDLATIGYFSLVALPYSLKFFWAPLMDRFIPPFLGRRRGWLVITQVALMLVIGAMSLHDPSTGLQLLAINAILIAFFSASQDIVFDAYRVDALDEREMGAGAAIGVMGYRIAMLLSGSAALILADRGMPWPTVYLLIALFMLVGIGGAFWAPEPVMHTPPPQSLIKVVVESFSEFFHRTGFIWGLLILFFVIFFQLPDRFVGSMATPFLLQIGFNQTDIGAIQTGIGLVATLVGVMIGGAVVAALGINKSMWIFVFIQILSNLAYYWIAAVGPNRGVLVVAIIVENICGGMVTAVFVAFMMSLCSREFSATQFALLSSLMAFARDVIVAPAGQIAESTGWPTYFLLTLAIGLPAILLLPWIAPWNKQSPRGAAVHTGDVTDDPAQAKAA
jgi:MFS transporter, PAT family, beta-lactamase induction signal transducer AmpG